jgi:putative ABC transport system permease protein
MTGFLTELKLAIRSLRRSPGFVAAATLSLALGIAVNSTIFAAIDVFLIRPLPYPDPDRLVQVHSTVPERGWDEAGVSFADFEDWKRANRSMELAAHAGASFNLTSGDEPVRIEANQSANLFNVLAVTPALGRGFLPGEEVVGGNRAVLLSNRFWLTQFDGDSSIIGRSIILNGEAYTVVGIMPAHFRFPDNRTQAWIPFTGDPSDSRDDRYFDVVGRLKPEIELEAAESEMSGITSRLATEYPETNAGHSSRVIPLAHQIYDETFRQASLICTVAVAFVLLIACANVANLMLARGAVQGRDLAVRAALGAGRWRLARKLLAESLVIALAGGALGLVMSFWGVKSLVSIMPAWFPRAEEIAVNGRLLLYILGLCLISGLIFGLAPAISASRSDIYSSLRETGRTGTPGAGHGRLRKTFVIAEISLALVLLIAAGLLVKASVRLQRVDLGFEPNGLLTARITLPEYQYPDSTTIIPFFQELVTSVATVQGVTSAGATSLLPMDGGNGTFYSIEGEPEPEKGKELVAQFRMITPEYLETIGTSLKEGRQLNAQDRLDGTKVALVNETLAERHWPGRSPMGRRVVLSSGVYEIVGVVRDARDFGPDDDTPALIYLPAAQRGWRSMSLVLRSDRNPAELAPAIRELVRARDAGLPVYDLRTMNDVIREDQDADRIMPKLLGVFGAIALVLAVLGVYGVMAYSVAQRTQEVGIRMALGADSGDILRLIVRQGGILALVGSVIGLLLAFGTTRGLSAFLFGVSAFDPVIFGGVTGSLLLAALVASIIPALRATRVNPIVALKNE